jgi:hypothetical protein
MEQNIPKIEGVTDLRNDLIDYYTKARYGQIPAKDIGKVTQIAAQIISSAKVQMNYNRYMNKHDQIPFLEK